MDWMLMPLQKYADFSGRSRRKEFWMFFLAVIIATFVAGAIDGVLGMTGMVGPYGPLYTVVALGTLVPSIACGVRRMHDNDKSGWFILIPIYNLILACTDGTKGANQYGPDPKAE